MPRRIENKESGDWRLRFRMDGFQLVYGRPRQAVVSGRPAAVAVASPYLHAKSGD